MVVNLLGPITKKNPTLEKLDKILINFEWENLFPLSSAKKIPRLMSDHNPIILDTYEKIDPRSREFGFEKIGLNILIFCQGWRKPGTLLLEVLTVLALCKKK
jgi:hypothetical protein